MNSAGSSEAHGYGQPTRCSRKPGTGGKKRSNRRDVLDQDDRGVINAVNPPFLARGHLSENISRVSLRSMTPKQENALPPRLVHALERWANLWKLPNLPSRSSIEWSSRLTCSLGRCYPHKGKVRLAASLQSADLELLEEVLCHEMAHLAAHELHGQRIRPHGTEWKTLIKAAGYEPKTRLPVPKSLAKAASPKRNRHDGYFHRCPVCQRTHVARRSMRSWHCCACVDAGLDGILTITRRKR